MAASNIAQNISLAFSVYIIDFKHVKANWNITIERTSVVIGKLKNEIHFS